MRGAQFRVPLSFFARHPKIVLAQPRAFGDRIRPYFGRDRVMEPEQRREPRYPFIACAEVLEEGSGARMNTRISDLSLGGCYVDTINPLPDGTSVQVKIFTETHSFEAPAT